MTDREHVEHVHESLAGTLKAIHALSAFVRGDPLPEPDRLLPRYSHRILELQDHRERFPTSG